MGIDIKEDDEMRESLDRNKIKTESAKNKPVNYKIKVTRPPKTEIASQFLVTGESQTHFDRHEIFIEKGRKFINVLLFKEGDRKETKVYEGDWLVLNTANRLEVFKDKEFKELFKVTKG